MDKLSPAQVGTLEDLEARCPATHFQVLAQDRHSRAALVEWDDWNGAGGFWLAPNGRLLIERRDA